MARKEKEVNSQSVIGVFGALVFALIVPTACAKEGVLPTLSVGDKWEWRSVFEGIEYTTTTEITGEDITDGKNCYVGKGSIVPPLQGIMDAASLKADKATMLPVRVQTSGEYMDMPFIVAVSLSYDFVDTFLYPLEVGRECEVVETETTAITMAGETQRETDTSTYVYKVEKMEEITVPAGTFRCFKIVKYDGDGNSVQSSWRSDKAKGVVKSIDHEIGLVDELVSYSVR